MLVIDGEIIRLIQKIARCLPCRFISLSMNTFIAFYHSGRRTSSHCFHTNLSPKLYSDRWIRNPKLNRHLNGDRLFDFLRFHSINVVLSPITQLPLEGLTFDIGTEIDRDSCRFCHADGRIKTAFDVFFKCRSYSTRQFGRRQTE